MDNTGIKTLEELGHHSAYDIKFKQVETDIQTLVQRLTALHIDLNNNFDIMPRMSAVIEKHERSFQDMVKDIMSIKTEIDNLKTYIEDIKANIKKIESLLLENIN